MGVVAILFFARRDIALAVEKIQHLNLWVLALMIPIQALSFYAVAQVFNGYFRTTGVRLPMKALFLSVIELNFVNHVLPSGGVSGFSYLTLRLKEYGVSTAKSTLAHLMRFILAFCSFILMLFLAVFLLAIEGRASGAIIFITTILSCFILFGTIVLAYIIGSLARIRQFARVMGTIINWLVHVFRRKHPETINLSKIEQTFGELHADYLLLRKAWRQMGPTVAWAFVANIAEVALIYVAFVAHGSWVNPGAVIIAYAIATITGLVAILPGGLGVYEPVMVATLLAGGVPGAVALSATLVARIVSMTLALGSGYFFYHKALRRYGNNPPTNL